MKAINHTEGVKRIVAGIDIGGTNTVFALVDAEGNFYGEGHVPTAQYVDIDRYQHDLAHAIREKLTDGVELVGVGIGAPNANQYDGTIEHAPNLPWLAGAFQQ